MTPLPLASPRCLMSGRGWMQQNSVHDDVVSWGKLGHSGELCHSLLWKRKNDNFHSSINILQQAKIAILASWPSLVWWLRWYKGAGKTIITIILSYFLIDFLFRKAYLSVSQTGFLKWRLVLPQNCKLRLGTKTESIFSHFCLEAGKVPIQNQCMFCLSNNWTDRKDLAVDE